MNALRPVCPCGKTLSKRNTSGLCRPCCGRTLRALQRLVLDPTTRMTILQALRVANHHLRGQPITRVHLTNLADALRGCAENQP